MANLLPRLCGISVLKYTKYSCDCHSFIRAKIFSQTLLPIFHRFLGIQVVPRILFALKSYDFGAFFISVLKIKTQTKGVNQNGKRITQGV